MIKQKYNETYFKEGQLWDTKTKQFSFNYYTMKDGLLLGMFQGNRGDRPDLDYIVKFLEPGEKRRLRTPKHLHWVVDLIIKKQFHSKEVKNFLLRYLAWYDEIEPFENIADRNSYEPFTPQIIKKSFKKLRVKGTYSLEYLAHIIELFIKCEKRMDDAFMFKDLLQAMVDYCDGKKDYFQIL